MTDSTHSLLVVSDTHVGSTVALWPEGQQIQDGGEYLPNTVQRWLYQQWTRMLVEVGDLPAKPTLVLLGDVIQGGGGKDAQLVSGMPSVQAAAALRLLRPLVEKCQAVYVVRGTEWHEGVISDNVEMLARELGGKQNPQTKGYTWPSLYLDLGGSLVHLAHHIGVSGVPSSEAGTPTREMVTLLSELARNWPADTPRLKMIIRAHRHRGILVQLPPDLHAMVCPGWQLSTAFSHKVAPSLFPHIGYGLVESRGGRLLAGLRTYPLPRPRTEVVE